MKNLLAIPSLAILAWSAAMTFTGHPIALLGFAGYTMLRFALWNIWGRLVLKKGDQTAPSLTATFIVSTLTMIVAIALLAATKSSPDTWRYSQYLGLAGGLLGWISAYES
jgi:hypothetical protein